MRRCISKGKGEANLYLEKEKKYTRIKNAYQKPHIYNQTSLYTCTYTDPRAYTNKQFHNRRGHAHIYIQKHKRTNKIFDKV